MFFLSKGGLKVVFCVLLFVVFIVIWINLFVVFYLDDLWVVYVSLVMGFIVFVLSVSFVVAILSYLYCCNKKFFVLKYDNVFLGLCNIYYIVFISVVIVIILGFWNIDFKIFFMILSIVVVVIVIIFKDYVLEIISGIIISFFWEVIIDDYVKIGEYKGKIMDINFIKIVLFNEDDDVIFIFNNKVFFSEIVNYI